MTEEKAVAETKKIFGEDSFTEFDNHGGIDCYYVGALPTSPGPYRGFMGFSWEEALAFARDELCQECKQGWTCEKHSGTPWPHDDCPGPGMPCQNRECKWRAENFPGINSETSLVGTAPIICSGCGGEINPDYGKCRRCG